jgi:8-oxo-dGTP pyrophosphatase MutT (NUDIX family)
VYGLETLAQKLSRGGPLREADLPAAADDEPRAAVAAILREGASGAELFFIVRAQSPRDPWSGHVAFPGGRKEPDDASLVATAIRETREEVGIDLGRGELLARLPDVPAFIRSKRGRLVVTPFVFAIREPVTATPNYEVAGTLWVPVDKLARGEGSGTHAFSWEDKPYELPCIRLEPGQHVLWGMTYRMLETMLDALG